MTDPTRIPVVLDALREVWEGQPDLDLATLWGIIENHGVRWGTDDATLLDVLRDISGNFPVKLDDAGFTGKLAIVDTQSPDRRITIDGDTLRVTVRAASGGVVPATWKASRLKRVETSSPVLLTDGSGIDHRLGVAQRIHLVTKPVWTDPAHRGTWGVLIQRGSTPGHDFAVIGPGVQVFRADRRSMETESHQYDRVLQAGPGQPLRIQRGSAVTDLGVVLEIFPLEG